MAFNTSYDSAKPVGSDDPKQIHTMIRTNTKEALRERLNVDHDFALDTLTYDANGDPLTTGTTMDGADVGKHRKVTLVKKIDTPSVADGQGVVYGKLVNKTGNDTSGDVVGLELFYKNKDGAEVQLTHNGVLNLSKTTLAFRVDGETISTVIKYTDSTHTTKDKEADGTDKYVLGVPDGGIPIEKLKTDVVDEKTLTIGTKLTDATNDGDAVVTKVVGGVTVNCQFIKIKDKGVAKDQLADNGIGVRNLRIPHNGASASSAGIACIASGSYEGTGNANTQVITAFDDGVTGRSDSDDYDDRIQIRKITIHSSGNPAIEVMLIGSTSIIWRQDTGANIDSSCVQINGNTFTVYGEETNTVSRWYYWVAWGEWVQRA